MDYQAELERLIEERRLLIISCTKNGVFKNNTILDGSFVEKLNKLNIDIGQLEDLMYG